MIIVDTSVAAGWILDDEKNEITDKILALVNEQTALMPLLWYYEIRSMVLTKERQKRLTRDETQDGLRLINNLPIDFDYKHEDRLLLSLARRHNLTGYDASYLELAIREDLPLATFDKAIIAAAKNEGIALLT